MWVSKGDVGLGAFWHVVIADGTTKVTFLKYTRVGITGY